MTWQKVKKIMGKNFIGPEELKKIEKQFPLSLEASTPPIPFSLGYLKEIGSDYILILGIPRDKQGKKLTINRMREIFGRNPEKSEPCFYNQDWYLKERFAKDETLAFKWYLIRKSVKKKSRGKDPEELLKTLSQKEQVPCAVLTAFVFFAYYFLTGGEILWRHDFIWCQDKDVNGDRIYTGRYLDPEKINKNGFNVHRHLAIRSCYGLASEIKNTQIT